MRAVYAAGIDPERPLAGLVVGEQPAPVPPAADWVTVRVVASALNHHDLWSLRGVGLRPEQLPMVLGCDAAGVDDQDREVIVHAVIGDPVNADETFDPARTLLSEKHPGTQAELVAVPRRNLVPKPPELSFVHAACLPTAWLTAYRMLITRGRVSNGSSVLVQGAGGGVATAAVLLANALGARVYATSRSGEKRDRIAALGATALEPGARLPERVDVVIETVGVATLEHSMKTAKPGGRIVVCGATSGHAATVDLRRVFFLQQELVGSTMGTRDELVALSELMVAQDIRPVVDSVFPLDRAADAYRRLESGDAFGKVLLDHALAA